MNSGTDDPVPDESVSDEYSIEGYFHSRLVSPDVLKSSNIRNPLPFSDSDFELAKLNKPFIPSQPPILVPPELFLVDYALINNFPQYVKNTLYAWHDATGETQQTFNGNLMKYFRKKFQKINPNLKYVSLVGLGEIGPNGLSKLRNSISGGRVIFHYIGYGFPQITADTLYFPGNIQVSPKDLFKTISSPSFYIFDCDNAGIMLSTFKTIVNEILEAHKDDDGDYQNTANAESLQYFLNYNYYDGSYLTVHDYFVLCATAPGEELPRDPALPRDFLTSVLLSPVKTAVLCHFYLNYRTTLNFDEISQSTINELEQLLDIIVDSIACEYLSGQRFQLLFRSDKTIQIIFRNFVLAQVILRPFGVHPISHPHLPDMSGHQLWEQWKAAVDNSVGSFATGRNVIQDYFDRAEASFNFLYSRKTLQSIAPSLLLTMIRAEKYKLPSKLIYQLPKSLEVIKKVIVFPDLFSNLEKLNPKGKQFIYLCFMIITIFKFDLNALYQIRHDFKWNILVEIIFNRSLSMKTRIIVASILTTCASYHKNLRQLCATQQFVRTLQKEMINAPPFLSTWLLLFFKRLYDVFPAKPEIFLPTGFHIQCALCVFHYSQKCRSAAISTMSCFMQESDMQSNLRYLMYALPAFNDISYLVRHQILMLILRFLTTHQNEFEQHVHHFMQRKKLACFSFRKLANSFTILPDKNSNYINFYEKINQEIFKYQYINLMLQFFLGYFASDPHPSISAEASSAHKYYFLKLKKDKEVDNDDNKNDDYFPFESDSDALYQITLRQTLDHITLNNRLKTRTRISFSNDNWSKDSEPSLKVECNLSSKPSSICFDPLSTGIVLAEHNSIVFYDNNLQNVWTVKLSSSLTTDLKVGSWYNDSLAFVCRTNGCCYICKNGNSMPIACWRADPNILTNKIPLFASIGTSRPLLATVRGHSYSVIWDVGTLKMVQETPNFQDRAIAKSIALHPSDNNLMMIGYENGTASLFDIRSNELINSITPPKSLNQINSSIPLLANSPPLAYPSLISNYSIPTFSSAPTSASSSAASSPPTNITILNPSAPSPTGSLISNNIISNSILDSCSIVKIVGNMDGDNTFYLAYDNGSCLKYTTSKVSNINGYNGTDIYDFHAHQILPILAFTPKHSTEQFILNESSGTPQKIKMDPAALCVFHPTQPICALSNSRELKIYRL